MPEMKINDAGESTRYVDLAAVVPRFPCPCEIGPRQGPVPATLVGVALREAQGGVRIEYIVTWWNQGNKVENYFAPSEVRFPAGEDWVSVGFRG